jgi:hypothetical protein
MATRNFLLAIEQFKNRFNLIVGSNGNFLYNYSVQ